MNLNYINQKDLFEAVKNYFTSDKDKKELIELKEKFENRISTVMMIRCPNKNCKDHTKAYSIPTKEAGIVRCMHCNTQYSQLIHNVRNYEFVKRMIYELSPVLDNWKLK